MSRSASEKIAADLSIISERISELPSVEALILMGGFGRGEGGVISIGGRLVPLNDYDLMIVTKQPDTLKEAADQLSRELAAEVGIDSIEIDLFHPARLSDAPISVYSYDLKYGSRVIWGDRHILDALPEYRSSDIPLWEGIRLLFNRMAGLLSGFSEERRGLLSGDESIYVSNQLVKATVSCGDALLIQHKQYHCLYRERKKRFARLVSSGHVPLLDGKGNRLIESAYVQKLAPNREPINDLWQEFESLLPCFELIFLHMIQHYSESVATTSIEAMDNYLAKHRSRFSLGSRILRLASPRRRLLWQNLADVEPRHRAYAALPLVLFSCPNIGIDDANLRRARKLLSSLDDLYQLPHQIEGEIGESWKTWDKYRQAAYECWQKYCH